MAVYAIGDVQGCYDELIQLIEKIAFNPKKDTLWFVGDLVNRGPKSLETLRYIKNLGDNAVSVLGNHDLHLLATRYGVRDPHKNPDLIPILEATDTDELLDWLQTRPILHYDKAMKTTMVHAGIVPQWTLKQARKYANELENVLASKKAAKFFNHMYGDKPDRWHDDLAGWDRYRFITNCFTRLRYCKKDGTMDHNAKFKPGTQPKKYLPWFAVPDRKTANKRIIFGHWSTLGIMHHDNAWSLDTGCVWGDCLTAMRLDCEPPEYTSIDCRQMQQPG